MSQIAPLALGRRMAPLPRPRLRITLGFLLLVIDGAIMAVGPELAPSVRFAWGALGLRGGATLALFLATTRSFLLTAWGAGTLAVVGGFLLMALLTLPYAGSVLRAVVEGAQTGAFFFLALFAPWRGDVLLLAATLGVLLTPRVALFFAGERGIRGGDLLAVLLSLWGSATVALGVLPWLSVLWGRSFPLASPGDLLKTSSAGAPSAWAGVLALALLAGGPILLASAIREGPRP